VFIIRTFFALTVLSGHENKIIKQMFDLDRGNSIRGIYALDKYHCFVTDEEKDIVNVLDLDEYELVNYLKLIQTKEYIETLQSALSTVELNETQQLKVQDEILRIKDEVGLLEPKKQSSLLRGYLLVETKDVFNELPSDVYQMWKSVNGITKIVSRLPIPQKEMNRFFKKCADINLQIKQFYAVQDELQASLQNMLVQNLQ